MSAASSAPITSSRASAKQKVADSWADRRKNTAAGKQQSSTSSSSKQIVEANDSLTVCQVFRNVWEQMALDVSRHFQPKRKTLPNASQNPRVFPSVVSVLQATAVSNIVESFGEEEQEIIMDVLSKDYDWQTAIQSSTQSRERAFLLMDVSAVVKSHYGLQKLFPGVDLQYKVEHNRDPKLLKLLGRLMVGLRTNSNLDVEAASAVEGGVLVDDAGATRKPNGYLRRYSKASNAPLAVDGPDEVARINTVHERLIQRHGDTHSLSYVLKLPRDCAKWESLVQSTQQACISTNTHLVGVSVEVMEDNDDYLKTLHDALERIALDGMHLDVTGAVTPNMAPVFSALAKKSFSRVSVDASELLVAQAGALCTRIIGVKEVGNVRHLYIDDGCYGSLCQDFRKTEKVHTPLPLWKNSEETQVTTVWGPTCDGLDRVCQNVILPKMHVDEWLVFFNMGQSSGMGTAFNGFDPPDVVHYCVLGHSRQF